MVNAVTTVIEYGMLLVEALLTDLDTYLWFCSLDAASGFWAIMMTSRARRISAFVCPLGHFEWLRMPFDLKHAPMIYQRMIDSALWGFVQPKGGWQNFAAKMKTAEEYSMMERSNEETPAAYRIFGCPQTTDIEDPVQQLVNGPEADRFCTNVADESTLIPVFHRRSFVDDKCFGGETFDKGIGTLDRLLTRFEECRISISFTKSIFVQPKVNFLSHEISNEGIRADNKKMEAIIKLPFPRTKKEIQSFLDALNYYSKFIQDFAFFGAAL
ncbi:hypothetical protein PHMEG_0007344 [Phytophthora megakarya]|uniref:Reverse transcriptase domain-containing protein n=1 Tax=Phytophthora megakarya TaxID=4795 RepID=A0A225WNW2_9STRA|nr:hypothetical protein PHMEG_0007344 [Phytophthora megakarya]